MASQVLVNTKLWVAGFDFTGDMNTLALKYGADMVDKTNFGSGGSRERLAGLKFHSFQHEGFVNYGVNNVDDAIWNSLFAIANSVMTIDPQAAGVEGDVVYTGQVDVAKYEPGAKVGAMLGFSVGGDCDGAPLVRGTLMKNATVSATGNGTGFQLGAVSASQKIYGAIHVPGAPAGTSPTLDVVLESAPASNFAAPTTRITFTQKTARGAQWGTPVAGSITDTWWRFRWTIGGTAGPTFPLVAVAGIITP